MRYLQSGLLIVFLLAVMIFAAQNTESTLIRFVSWEVRMPLAILVILIYLLGMISGWSVIGFVRRSIRNASAHSRSE
ncbi:MAG TPA: LapA family protein [Isosphaeraceae bacterium]|nr:LapA family protein [Isosphaeraceae bacterium]